MQSPPLFETFRGDQYRHVGTVFYLANRHYYAAVRLDETKYFVFETWPAPKCYITSSPKAANQEIKGAPSEPWFPAYVMYER